MGEGTGWKHLKLLLQKHFLGSNMLSMVWMGLLTWFDFPVVNRKSYRIVLSMQGVLLLECVGICALLQ